MAKIVIGLSSGDEGKGTMVEYFSQEESLVVRFNGGPQAAHHVVNSRGTHCFSQFGSGTFFPSSLTYLSRFTLVDPLAILAESDALKEHGVSDALTRLYVNANCPIITPFQRIINRMRETAGLHKKGSCGMGVGETVSDLAWMNSNSLFVGDLHHQDRLREKLKFLQYVKRDIAEQLVDQNPYDSQLSEFLLQLSAPDFVERLADVYVRFVNESGVHVISTLPTEIATRHHVVFEGAQGILLDPECGFLPYITKTKTTFVNSDIILRNEFPDEHSVRMTVMRAYSTRHGPGPFPTEDSVLGRLIPDYHNGSNAWQGQFRIGWFDLVAARYALGIAGNHVDNLILTNTDRLNGFARINVATAYTLPNLSDKLDEYFVWEKTADNHALIADIKIPKYSDAARQQELTRLLNLCQPVYREFSGWESIDKKEGVSYITFLERELHAPIGVVSNGPCIGDKIRREDL